MKQESTNNQLRNFLIPIQQHCNVETIPSIHPQRLHWCPTYL